MTALELQYGLLLAATVVGLVAIGYFAGYVIGARDTIIQLANELEQHNIRTRRVKRLSDGITDGNASSSAQRN